MDIGGKVNWNSRGWSECMVMVVVSHSSFFCSIVVDEIANVIEMMPSGGSHDTKRPRQSD